METAIVINKPVSYYYVVSTLALDPLRIEIPKIKRAFDAVSIAFEISRERLKTDNSRRRDIVMCRQSVWKIVRDADTHISLKSLGAVFGKFDHTTVIHGIDSIERAMLTDELLVEKFTKAKELFIATQDQVENREYYDY
jgi:chromosomal replication initiation ATPase DnaA